MTTALDHAARELADRRRTGRRGPRLPADAVPADVAAALALQRRVAALMGDAIGGWKCALPAGGRTIVAPLFAKTIVRTSPCAVRVRGDRALIEAEIASSSRATCRPAPCRTATTTCARRSAPRIWRSS